MALHADILQVRHNDKLFELLLVKEMPQPAIGPVLSLDLPVREPEKTAAMLRTKLGLNTRVFARNCEVKKLDKQTATGFLDRYHLMNATQSGFNYGLFHKQELVAVASFSKGRKMNRLEEHQRSFELIRFCCKNGITVTGGLSKLLKNFCREKKAGDVMTYVDKQFSDGKAFLTAGFKMHSETPPIYFLVNRKSFERIAVKNSLATFDKKEFYAGQTAGNLKMIYTPNESI